MVHRMRLKLEKVTETDQLSACNLSLLLGVFTEDNKIERYLRLARGILNVKKAIFAFHHEPYVWLMEGKRDFTPIKANNTLNLNAMFAGELMIYPGHRNYQQFSEHLDHLGVEHKRVLCFNIQHEASGALAQVAFYDDETGEFTKDQMELLEELTSGLIAILEKKSESQDYAELYEQQCALNFSKTKFFQIIAHDLRAPFHGLIGFSDVLAHERETLNEADQQDIAHYLHDTIQSTYNLLENLLNWAMAEGGRFVYHPINYKLKQSTAIVYDVLNTLAVKKNIKLIEDVPDHLKIFADINMVTSIIQNLVSNALKFTQTDGTGEVTIRAYETTQGVAISIQDTGLGMNEAQIAAVFEPQIKASIKGTTGEHGTGLGLVLCKRFVDLNHGTITVMSNEGKGTIFNVILPMATQSARTLMLERQSVG